MDGARAEGARAEGARAEGPELAEQRKAAQQFEAIFLRQLLGSLEAHRSCLVLVSNELGMGVVPDTALGRSFRDLVGRVHQRLAPRADELYLATLGVILRLHPAPVTTYFP